MGDFLLKTAYLLRRFLPKRNEKLQNDFFCLFDPSWSFGVTCDHHLLDISRKEVAKGAPLVLSMIIEALDAQQGFLPARTTGADELYWAVVGLA